MRCKSFGPLTVDLPTDWLRLPDLKVKPWVPQTHESFYLVNATIIDAANGQLMRGEYAIKVEGGNIVSVESQQDARLDNGVRQIDVKGKYICPGLIDAHVHVCAVPGVEVRCSLICT